MQIDLDEIVSIKKIGKQETIDITVSGDNLFFANDILTHNSGASNTDMDITDTSESFGGPMTADLLLALISTEEFEEQNKILIKQLKNRYSDPTIHKRFFVGIERSKMRLYDVDQGTVDSSSNEPYNNNEPKSQLKEKFGEFKF